MDDRDRRLGLYEDLVTSAIEEQIGGLLEQHEAVTAALRDDEAADRLALHLGTVVRRALERATDPDISARGARAKLGSAAIRSLLRQLEVELGSYVAAPDFPADEPQVLNAIVQRLPGGSLPAVARPITPLLDTTVLTNSKHDQNMYAHLRSEVRSAGDIDAIIAFIRRAGVGPLIDDLRDAIGRGYRVRVLTTSFTGFTEVEALEQLAAAGATIRVSYDTSAQRLHAKAWVFHRPAGGSTAYVGSSNMTMPGFGAGMEWNVRLAERRNPDAVAKMVKVFDSYWHSGDFKDFDPQEYRDRAPVPGGEDRSEDMTFLDVRPYPFQERMLELLRVARELGHHHNLLVAATGTGKTVMAALDYKHLRSTLPRSRLLFVAHREEILDQSLRTFRMVLADGAFGEKWVGGQRPVRFDHVFASIQSLSSQGSLAHLDPQHFDVVIVDEFHHAAAASYVGLLDKVDPRELLGLTATPERADGLSVLDYFDGRIAAEMRLWDAIAEQRLVPFEYFALHDGASLLDVPWKRGRGYDIEALANVYTSDDAWVRLVIRQTNARVDIKRMRALGFCVSVAHARFSAHHFTQAGIPAVAVWGNSPQEERRQALRDLREGRVRVVFSVDLFNEGVDIPQIDTLLMLRPTESATLFLQQLGRGLRHHQDKEVCTVLDFISQHRREFRFDLKLRALIGGGTRRDLTRNIEAGFPNLPPGASATMNPVAQQIILSAVRDAIPLRRPQMVAELKAMIAAGHEPSLANFLDHSGLELTDVYAPNRSFSDLLGEAGVPLADEGTHEQALRRAIGRLLHVDDRERIDFYTRTLASGPFDLAEIDEHRRRLWRMLVAQVVEPAAGMQESLQSATQRLWQHPQVVAELRQLFEVLGEAIDHEHPALDGTADCPLLIHARYTRIEIQAGLGDGTAARVPTWREGVRWLPEVRTDAFVATLDKSEGNFSPTNAYRDFALSRTLFHWESQSTTSPESPTGRRYQHHAGQGSTVLLFARMTRFERDYWFLGPVTYVRHQGSRPMQIEWRLHYPIPADLYPDFAAVAVA